MSIQAPRFSEKDVCAECGICNGKLCEPARVVCRDYEGIRFTSDGFDCALPVSIDSHSHCSYACKYCFSDNLIQHREQTTRAIGQTSLSAVERIFSGDISGKPSIYFTALDIPGRSYRCPVQLGAINDAGDHIERQQGWLLKFIELAIKYNQPVRMSTKGTIFQLPEYQAAISKAPHLFWVAFSIISPDDQLMRRVDVRAPVPSERLKTMGILSKMGVKTSLRFRPLIPGISDATKDYPNAYRTLIDKAADNGAKAISYEVIFVPGGMTKEIRARWEALQSFSSVNLIEKYTSFGNKDACMRPAYTWTENIMHAIAEHAKSVGMTVGVSDPVWKQLGDTGCCCGILPDDPVFGNWQRESATNQLLEAKWTGKEIHLEDIIPAWARAVKKKGLCNTGVGPTVVYYGRHYTWADNLTYLWDNVKAQRNPLLYFQGAIRPTGKDNNGHLIYKYFGLERKFLASDWVV